LLENQTPYGRQFRLKKFADAFETQCNRRLRDRKMRSLSTVTLPLVGQGQENDNRE
jgi:hypothetical protein